jgi:hypothetical protein
MHQGSKNHAFLVRSNLHIIGSILACRKKFSAFFSASDQDIEEIAQ